MLVGVDVGGTFTDFVVFDGEMRTFKLASDQAAPERPVLQGLAQIGLSGLEAVVHGSTVATNAVLERRGARTAFVTTGGFRDLLTIGRQNRSQLYDLFADRPTPLVPEELCFEVAERLDHHGQVLEPLGDDAPAELAERVRVAGAEAAAVCLLFSFLNPAHEQRVLEALSAAGIPATASSQLLPEFREYERASTTALNAYVLPVMSSYLRRLQDGLGDVKLRIMQSNGGSLSAAQAASQPARAILSGPAGGVVGALQVARQAGFQQVMTFDMGGTSTDVSLSTGAPPLTSEGEIDGLPLRLPMIDIHTVGSGGGSIARADPGGSLRVGPQSAGASPGPACYARGGSRATVTDANLVLGRLDPDQFLGGEMALDAELAHAALDRLGGALGFEAGPGRGRRAALGVVRVANAHMARALRVVSVSRGHDPRPFTLVSFGGAGGLHACDVARAVGIRRVLIPPIASTLSAYGMVVVDVKRDYVQTVMLDADTPFEELARRSQALETEGRRTIEGEGIAAERISAVHRLDVRYAGQAYELPIPLVEGWLDRFHAAHQQEYGYSDPALPVQVVNLRVEVVGRVGPPATQAPSIDAGDPELGKAPVVIGDDPEQLNPVPHFAGPALPPGFQRAGPGLIVYPDTTVLVGSGDRLVVDSQRNLIIEVASP